ncbi:HDIG domain-containing metalloprotein [Aminiphilus sp.]|jgi:putative nucleotidyltransferase with HDIG domain|uniref:HDIG domain-containing metalloprotein n=1 Tax=Aminiphilus sp. TaxID=1872488 RepID=UPI002611FA2D|nr:HDIG domain-containing metalloprotein [Aminiphilus sp.]
MTKDREHALALLKQHNTEEMHVKHALAVEAAMRHFAVKYGEDPDAWGVVGLLHDIDWEETMADPQRHTEKALPWLREAGYPESVVRAVRSHAWGLLQEDVQPESPMEKVLYAIDELTGFVVAVALVRPSKSLGDMEGKSVKKKWKDKAFARGVDRDVIAKGAELLGVSLDSLIEETIVALRPVAKEIGLEG